MNGLDLFSGIGGISLALKEWVRTVAYCEIDPYCQRVLLSRMASGNLEEAPIWDDIRTLRAEHLPEIDIIFGGFPCQDISCAGRGAGLAGQQSGLFFEVKRLADEIRPKFIFLENVPAITVRGGARVVSEIASMGYDCRWLVISAASVGALHRRERWFLLAHSNKSSSGRDLRELSKQDEELKEFQKSGEKKTTEFNNGGDDGNTDSEPSVETNTIPLSNAKERHSRRRSSGQHWPFESREHWQETVSGICGVSDGVCPELDIIIFICEGLDKQRCKEIDYSKEDTEIDLFNREVLRTMWQNRGLAKTSPELYLRKLYDIVPELSHKLAQTGRLLGKRIEESSELCFLWEKFYTSSIETEQALWQSRLLERLWEIKRREKMEKENHVNRLRALGNSVVPQQVKEAFKILMGVGQFFKSTNYKSK